MNQVIEHQLDNHILHCSHHLHENIRDYIEMQWWDEAKPQIGHTLPELVLEEEVLPKVHCTILCSPRYTVLYSAPQGSASRANCSLDPVLWPGASRRLRVSDGSSLPGFWSRPRHSLESLQQALPSPGHPHRRPGMPNRATLQLGTLMMEDPLVLILPPPFPNHHSYHLRPSVAFFW